MSLITPSSPHRPCRFVFPQLDRKQGQHRSMAPKAAAGWYDGPCSGSVVVRLGSIPGSPELPPMKDAPLRTVQPVVVPAQLYTCGTLASGFIALFPAFF